MKRHLHFGIIFYAFLDINPFVNGHTLVIPHRDVDYCFDMTVEEFNDISDKIYGEFKKL